MVGALRRERGFCRGHCLKSVHGMAESGPSPPNVQRPSGVYATVVLIATSPGRASQTRVPPALMRRRPNPHIPVAPLWYLVVYLLRYLWNL